MWSEPRRTSRDSQRRYSDLTIETGLTYRFALRQPQGLSQFRSNQTGNCASRNNTGNSGWNRSVGVRSARQCNLLC